MLTNHKRSLGQGNAFTPVCHFVHRGGVGFSACITGHMTRGDLHPGKGLHPGGLPPGEVSASGGYVSCYRPQTKFAKVMFLQVSVCPWGGMHGCSQGGHVWLLLGGHAWLLWGGMSGCSWGGAWLLWGACVVAWGACVVAQGGRAWFFR